MPKYGNNIDANGFQLLSARVHNLSSAPSSPGTGQMYYDTTLNYLRVWDGAAWQRVSFGADPYARTSHTGSQAAVTISDLGAVVKAYRLDEFAAPTVAVSAGNQRIINVGNPSAAQDAANKAYVDAAVNGFDWKQSVRAATTGNITLSGTQTIDAVALVAGNRVLVKNQSTPSQNGIYVVAAGAWSRATDADADAEVTTGMATFVEGGTVNGGQQWVLTTADPISVGTTSLTFGQVSGSSSVPIAGDGLLYGSNTYYVAQGYGIDVDADSVNIDAGIVARKYIVLIGDGSSTSIPVVHNFGNKHVAISVYEEATGFEVLVDKRLDSTTTCTIIFGTAPTTNSMRVVVTG